MERSEFVVSQRHSREPAAHTPEMVRTRPVSGIGKSPGVVRYQVAPSPRRPDSAECRLHGTGRQLWRVLLRAQFRRLRPASALLPSARDHDESTIFDSDRERGRPPHVLAEQLVHGSFRKRSQRVPVTVSLELRRRRRVPGGSVRSGLAATDGYPSSSAPPRQRRLPCTRYMSERNPKPPPLCPRYHCPRRCRARSRASWPDA